MQRERQGDRAFVAQPVHAGNHSRGRHRDAPARKPVRVVVEHQPQRGNHVVQIEKGLPHSHHDDVRHRPFALEQPVREPQLADDFRRAEVAVEALLAGRAESAVQHAARLARYAERAAVRLGDENRLYRVAAVHLEQPLARPVLRSGVADDARSFDAGAEGELVAQRPGEVAHAGEVGFAALVDPVQQLASAERLFLLRLEEAAQARGVEVEEILLQRENTSQAGKK